MVIKLIKATFMGAFEVSRFNKLLDFLVFRSN